MIVHPNQVTVMIAWLVLCMTGIVGPIANAAHVAGISVGVALGCYGFRPVRSPLSLCREL